MATFVTATTTQWCVRLLRPRLFPPLSLRSSLRRLSSYSTQKAVRLAMDCSSVSPLKETPMAIDEATEEIYASQSKLLQDFINISTIDKAWTFNSSNGKPSQAMFLTSQPNLLANKRRSHILSSHILKENTGTTSFQWAPFPIELTGISTIVPSPSGSKLLVVRNPENDSPAQFEIWGASQVEKEFHIPNTVHGSVYCDGWFEGISWNDDESLIAYVAEEPAPSKPTFNSFGYKKGGSTDKDFGSWKGQGDWEEDWGETYAGKRRPALFVIDTNSGEVRSVKGIGKSLSVGQVVWAPSTEGLYHNLVFVGWIENVRKLGIKYCYNRPCALYSVRSPFFNSEDTELHPEEKANKGDSMINLTQSITSAYFPRFSPEGKFLVFLSSKSSVDSGAHSATNSLHRIDWSNTGKLDPSVKIVDVVPVVMCPEDGCFPGLYCSNFLPNPWLSDGYTMVLSSLWGSNQAILSVDVLSGKVERISSSDLNSSWNVLALDGDNIISVCSSLVDVPQIKYGCPVEESSQDSSWSWADISSPICRYSEKVKSLLSSLQFRLMKIPVRGVTENLSKGASKPFEAMFVSSKYKKSDECDPMMVILHGGPHSVSVSAFSKSLAFLSSIGFSLLIVNYRGSLGFGEEALQSLPGNIGTQDVNDVLTAIDHVIDLKLANPSKISVLGGSHGGFLTTHLIANTTPVVNSLIIRCMLAASLSSKHGITVPDNAPDKFVAAAVRNPVCNLALMVGTTDIPDWCYVESCGTEGSSIYTEASSVEQLALFHSKSPISHLPKVKTPTLFLLGAKDLRVPVSNGLQYARALKEKGAEVKVIVFPNDVHGIEKPQSDFESFLNIGVWFKKYCK